MNGTLSSIVIASLIGELVPAAVNSPSKYKFETGACCIKTMNDCGSAQGCKQAETFTQGFYCRCFATDFTAASTANNTPAPKQKVAEDKHRSRGTWLLDIAAWHGAEDHVNHLRRPAISKLESDITCTMGV